MSNVQLTYKADLRTIVGEIIDEWELCGDAQSCCDSTTEGPTVCGITLKSNLHVTFFDVTVPEGGADHPIIDLSSDTLGNCYPTITTLKNQSYRVMYVGTVASMLEDPLPAYNNYHVYILADSKPIGGGDYFRGTGTISFAYGETYSDSSGDPSTTFAYGLSRSVSTVSNPFQLKSFVSVTLNAVTTTSTNVVSAGTPHPNVAAGYSTVFSTGQFRIWRGHSGLSMMFDGYLPREKAGLMMLAEYGPFSIDCENTCICVSFGRLIWSNLPAYSGSVVTAPAEDVNQFIATGDVGYYWSEGGEYSYIYDTFNGQTLFNPYIFPVIGNIYTPYNGPEGGYIPYIPFLYGGDVIATSPTPMVGYNAWPNPQCSNPEALPALWVAYSVSQTYSGHRDQDIVDDEGSYTVTITTDTDWDGSMSADSTGPYFTDIKFYQQLFLIIYENTETGKCSAVVSFHSGALSKASGKGNSLASTSASGVHDYDRTAPFAFTKHQTFEQSGSNEQHWEQVITSGDIVMNTKGMFIPGVSGSGTLPNITIPLDGGGTAVVSL